METRTAKDISVILLNLTCRIVKGIILISTGIVASCLHLQVFDIS